MNDEKIIRLELIKEALQKNRAVCINDGVPVATSPTLAEWAAEEIVCVLLDMLKQEDREPFDADVELDKLYPPEQTNEEMLRGCTFEEMAGAIYEWYTLGYTRGKNGVKLNSITEVVEWLKEKHGEVIE